MGLPACRTHVNMTTFDETLHPREAGGRFAAKRNDAPTGTLTESAEQMPAVAVKPVGHSITVRAATERGLVEVDAEVYDDREMIPASKLAAGDVILWESVDDTHGTRYWEETVTHVQVGVDLNYRRRVTVETPGAPRGVELSYGSLAARRAPAEEPPVVYPPLRDGRNPAHLAVSVDSSDSMGSWVTLQETGMGNPPMLDRFRTSEVLTPGTVIPLLESSRAVQETVADRFIPLAGLSLGETLRREPRGHSGRAWND